MPFDDQMKKAQIAWRHSALPDNLTPGPQNGGHYDHVLPRQDWKLNLWPGIVRDLPVYLDSPPRIQRHTGCHNLCSSWIVCANLYFPFRSLAGRQMLAAFLRDKISSDIVSVTNVELEYEHPQVRPSALGEKDGHRGSGQTSPDVASEISTRSGSGVILVECKFTEHNFYSCSGHKKKDQRGRPPNPDPSRCEDYGRVLENPDRQCHLASWKRRYWDYLWPASCQAMTKELSRCPATIGGYQLLRQHALALAIAARDKEALVASAVAYDGRNPRLMRCMARSTGLKDIATDWPRLFGDRVVFKTFTHQSWVAWVAEHDSSADWSDWVRYVSRRYEFAEHAGAGVAPDGRPQTAAHR
jgi:hypothetical protein